MSEPYGVYATPAMELVAKEVYNMEVRSDDIWIVTFPKCGTTLTQVKKNIILVCFRCQKNPSLKCHLLTLKRWKFIV